ncbi:MAG: hydroxymethylglutaryl-CoA lyase [Bacteroidetes bacterium]|nr:hydroxymethylglutaryl-CoA lyase [Bacteroidota bacterium]
MENTKVKLIECPRDAMQGWKPFIPTATKIEYINALLKVGFDTIDFGSFVSPKAIPQLADTKEVLKGLNLDDTKSKLLAIIANTRGADEAVQYDEIHYLGFPFSISETFQQLNTNSSIEQSLQTVEAIQNLCVKHDKKLVTYISMGFGNPYGDEYSSDIAIKWVEKLSALGIDIFAMSDTVGVSNPENISYIFSNLLKAFPRLEFGAHFHSVKNKELEKLEAAFENQCYRFDSALNGIGGCPMAQDELVGNMTTETVLTFLESKGIDTGIDKDALDEALLLVNKVFSGH